MKLSKNFFKNFLFNEMPLSEAAILAYEQKQKIFEIPRRRFLICVVSASFVTILTPLPHLAQFLHYMPRYATNEKQSAAMRLRLSVVSGLKTHKSGTLNVWMDTFW